MEKRQGRKTTVRFSFPSSPHFSQRENLFNQLFIVRSKCHRFAFAFAFASPSPPESKPSQMQMLLHANPLLLAPTTSRLSASASASASPGRSGTARPLPPPQGHAHSARAAARGTRRPPAVAAASPRTPMAVGEECAAAVASQVRRRCCFFLSSVDVAIVAGLPRVPTNYRNAPTCGMWGPHVSHMARCFIATFFVKPLGVLRVLQSRPSDAVGPISQ